LFVILFRQAPDAQQALVPLPTYDLDGISHKGKLVALTDNSSTSFYIYKGDSLGYEYELLRSFARSQGLDLELKVTKDMNSVFLELNRGSVDVVAANLTVTKERVAMVDFTDPFMLIPQVLVQRKPDGWEKMTAAQLNEKLIRNTVDLSRKKIHVRKGSSFYSRLMSLSEEIGEKINIVEVPGDWNTEMLISKVANGEIDYTVADENVALNNQTYYSNLDVATPISFPQKISWAVRKESPLLLNALNKWIAEQKGTKSHAALYSKYFKDKKEKQGRGVGSYANYANGVISEYDDIIKVYSQKIGWDWQLLAALISQESNFSASARSWAGASGLMQLVPQTAKHYGLDTTEASAEQSIIAGTNYILDLERYWKKYISDKDERLKFVLASYNAGLGHVVDARNLAIKFEKNPDLWDENVGAMILQKSNPLIYNDPVVKCGYCRGQETYNYVKEILNRYSHYKKIPVPGTALATN
jgi:membrane-bound lytic murein transglycosylase F